MSRFLIVILILLLTAFVARRYIDDVLFSQTTPRAVEPRGSLADYEKTTVDIFQKDAPSVVQVVGQTASSGQPEGAVGVQTGSGFIWDRAGHVITNNHVVQGTDQVAVRFSTGELGKAQIVGVAPNYDLAVLQVSTLASLPPPLAIGSSSDLRVGQSAFAIGNPFGLDETMTNGIVSALKRRLPTSGGREIAGAIQTDAPINPGNSGGPLLDSAGRLIGVTTAILSPSGTNAGIGFAIPVDVVNHVVPDLIRNGRVPTPGIGIVSADESTASQLGIQGVAVMQVAPGSPAESAGLRGVDQTTGAIGDVIVAANGEPVRTLTDLIEQVESVGIGKSIDLTVQKDGSKRSVKVGVVDIGEKRP